MSSYATMAEIGIRRFGDRESVDFLIQGAPPHIDYVGPQWDFLPPAVDPNGETMRAVFVVEAGDDKGTPRCGQEYVKPLLMLTGKEYDEICFSRLITPPEEALNAKNQKRPTAIFY